MFPFIAFTQEVFDDIDDLFNTTDETIEDDSAKSDTEDAETPHEEMDIDSLFESPDETLDDTEAVDKNQENAEKTEEESEDKVDIASLTKSDKPTVKGSLGVEGAVAIGFLDWPVGVDETYFTQLGGEFDGSAYYSMSPAFTIDVRPTSYFRFYTSLSTSLSRSSLSFGYPSFGELFIDYTFSDTYFFRVGKQSLTWGQGLLVGNIGDIVNDVDDGIAIKSFIPLGPNGLTSLLYTTDGSSVNPLNFSYAALFDMTVGPVSMGLSAKFNRTMDKELLADLYLKTVIGDVDVSLEARGDFDMSFGGFDGSVYQWPTWYAQTNFFWEDSGLGIQLLGEYIFSYGSDITVNNGWKDDGTIKTTWAEYGQHRIGLGIRSTKGWIRDFKPGLLWYHNFADSSGQFVLGVSGTFSPLISAEIGIPIVYGPDYGFYRLNSDDPENRVLSLIVRLTLESSFSF